jgi:hypothetical protein
MYSVLSPQVSVESKRPKEEDDFYKNIVRVGDKEIVLSAKYLPEVN